MGTLADDQLGRGAWKLLIERGGVTGEASTATRRMGGQRTLGALVGTGAQIRPIWRNDPPREASTSTAHADDSVFAERMLTPDYAYPYMMIMIKLIWPLEPYVLLALAPSC
jgi:hypothetical protein